MFVIGAVMLIDTYGITMLIDKYKVAAITNKELDKRDGREQSTDNIIREKD